MNDQQRHTLDECLVSFCENLDIDSILPYLQSKKILLEHHVELIRSKDIAPKRRYELISILKTRGVDAYTEFHNALVISGQLHLARLLYPTQAIDTPVGLINNGNKRRSLIPEDPEIMSLSMSPDQIVYPAGADLLAHPTINSVKSRAIEQNERYYQHEILAFADTNVLEPAGILDRLEVETVDTGSLYFRDLYHNDDIYPNFTNPKGLALIINNHKFTGRLPDRLGTDVDEVNMTRLLQQIGYKVKVKKDLRAEEMMHAIVRFAANPEHRLAHSTVVVVLTHGEHGKLYGVDEQTIAVDRFVSILNSEHCPNLRHKPKLFFMQACRGERYDAGHERIDGYASGDTIDDGDDDRENGTRVDGGVTSRIARVMRKCVERWDSEDANAISSAVKQLMEKYPLEADVLIAYATTPGYVSWRNSCKGSWFIQSLCEVFAQYAHRDDVLSMLTKVNKKVAHAFQSSDGGYKQMPEPCFRFTKKFYFFPGYSGEAPSLVDTKK